MEIWVLTFIIFLNLPWDLLTYVILMGSRVEESFVFFLRIECQYCVYVTKLSS